MEQLGKYQLIRKLATGGMAEVFLARAAGPMGFQKTVVVKRILPHFADDPQFIGMFLSEAKLAAELNHPNIVQIFDFGKEGKTYFIAMEYIDGLNLRTLYRRSRRYGLPLPLHLCAKIISAACEGLAFAHDFRDPETGAPLNLIHRDVSPDNILLSRTGAVKVVDFGIAKASNQTHLTRSGVVKGKMAYMPPEQLGRRPMDRRVDVFALGVVFYELVTGMMPFDATSEVSIIQALMSPEPLLRVTERRDDIPKPLEQIITRALEKSPDDRYPSCRALQEDIERFLHSHGQPVTASDLAGLVIRAEEAKANAAQAPETPPGEDGAGEADPTSDARRVVAEAAAAGDPLAGAEPHENGAEDSGFADTFVRPEPRPGDAKGQPLEPRPEPATDQLERSIRPRRGPVFALLGAIVLLGAGVAWLLPRGGQAPAGHPPAAPAPVAAAPAAPAAPPGTPAAPAPSSPQQPGPAVSPAPATPPAPAQPKQTAAVEPQPPSTEQEPATPGTAKPPEKATTSGHGKAHAMLEFRIRPYAQVYLDGKSLGQTPFPAVATVAGKHTIRMVNPKLDKDLSVEFVVKANKDNVFKYNLKE